MMGNPFKYYHKKPGFERIFRARMYNIRVKRLQGLLPAGSAIFIYEPANIFYLTGFRSSNAYLIIDRKRCVFFTDFRYLLAAEKQIVHAQVLDLAKEPYVKWLNSHRYRTVFFEDKIPYWLFDKLSDLRAELEIQPQFLEWQRAVKTPEEAAVMKQALDKTIAVIPEITAFIRDNRKKRISEMDILRLIRRSVDEHQFQGLSFLPIVAIDENSAVPHHAPSEESVITDTSSLILLDFGFFFQDYASDFTRMIFLREPDKELIACHALLERLFSEFETRFSEWTHVSEIDSFFREGITKAGYGEMFRHSTGHSIGLECHEFPSVSPTCKEEIRQGMVFTIEPGIYIPGKGGIRFEDVFYVSPTGLTCLTDCSRSPIYL